MNGASGSPAPVIEKHMRATYKSEKKITEYFIGSLNPMLLFLLKKDIQRTLISWGYQTVPQQQSWGYSSVSGLSPI